jgi:hypothetical protein
MPSYAKCYLLTMIDKLSGKAYLGKMSIPRKQVEMLTQHHTKAISVHDSILCIRWLSGEDDRLPFLLYSSLIVSGSLAK